MYLINPGKRKKKVTRSKRFAKSNPMKKSRRRRRSFARTNPVKRRRRRFAKRNPARRRGARIQHMMVFPNSMKRKKRRSFSRRNPVRRSRRRSFIRRNPAGGIGATIFDRDTMILAGGVVLGTVGTNYIMNKLLLPGTTGAVPFNLPGVNFQQTGYMNSLPVAAYKFGIGAAVGYLLRNKAPALSQGIVVGAFAGALSSVIQSSNLLSGLPGATTTPTSISTAAGTGRFFRPRGMGANVPGVPSIFTGPASGFLNRGSPMARTFGQRRMMRSGAGAMFNGRMAKKATNAIPDPFGN